MSGLSPAASGTLLPTLVAARVLDRARPRTRVLEAGAQVLPMGARTVDLPVWVSDPGVSYRGEGTAVPFSDGRCRRSR